MIKIAMIGAGGVGFTRGLLRDIYCARIRRCRVPLYGHLEKTQMAATLAAKPSAKTGCRRASGHHQPARGVAGADYVICTARVGG